MEAVASPAMGHWGTCPFDFQQFHFSSLWSKSDSQLSKYCVVCEISWCRCQQLTAHSSHKTISHRSAAAVGPEVCRECSMTLPNFQLCPSSQQILATPLYGKKCKKYHFKHTSFNSYTRVTVYAECVYLLTEYLKYLSTRRQCYFLSAHTARSAVTCQLCLYPSNFSTAKHHAVSSFSREIHLSTSLLGVFKYRLFVKILSSSLNTMLIVDKHCSDAWCCDEFPVPQIDRKSKKK